MSLLQQVGGRARADQLNHRCWMTVFRQFHTPAVLHRELVMMAWRPW